MKYVKSVRCVFGSLSLRNIQSSRRKSWPSGRRRKRLWRWSEPTAVSRMFPTERKSRECFSKWASALPRTRRKQILFCLIPVAIRSMRRTGFRNVGALKYLKRRNPSLIIALCGCMMEQEHVVERIRKSYPFVSLVFGTHSLSSFPQLVYETLTGARECFSGAGGYH